LAIRISNSISLFYHRDLQCLVAFELGVVRFEPEHLGKLSFYLQALDRIAGSRTKTPAAASCFAAPRMMKWLNMP